MYNVHTFIILCMLDVGIESSIEMVFKETVIHTIYISSHAI